MTHSQSGAHGIIDVHAHHYPERFLQLCCRPDSRLEYREGGGRLLVLQDGAVVLACARPMPPVSHRLAMMDEAGIDVQVLSLSAPNVYRFAHHVRESVTRELNNDLVEEASKAPERLRVLASLPLPDLNASRRELERVLGLSGVVGITLCTTIDGLPLDSPTLVPLWQALHELEVAVLIHPTVGCSTQGLEDFALSLVVGFVAETTTAIARLLFSGVLERYPAIRWIFTHAGGSVPFIVNRFDTYAMQFPDCRDAVSRKPSEILSRLHFDTVTTHGPALRCAVETFGPGQFLFGSDYPHVPDGLVPFVDVLDELELGHSGRLSIERGNASRLLGVS
jgi:predicted TIM-barrel fold metal-dependent hydrolase